MALGLGGDGRVDRRIEQMVRLACAKWSPQIGGVLLAAPALAAEPPQTPTRPADPAPPADRPEHRLRPLPDDTFQPSESISEDYPVPFPVDI